jgi:sugar-specific transcriptional regulator TrmB
MSSEERPRRYPLVNPEHAVAILRRIVEHFDSEDEDACEAFGEAIKDARKLLKMDRPAVTTWKGTQH